MGTCLRAGIIGLAALVGTGVPAAALLGAQSEQTDAPRFEVASVKPSTAGGERDGNIGGGRFTMTHATLRDLVAIAYPREDGPVRTEAQIAGGPSWFNTDHFDVLAYASGALAGVDASHTAAGAST